jgi:hypothetical protein
MAGKPRAISGLSHRVGLRRHARRTRFSAGAVMANRSPDLQSVAVVFQRNLRLSCGANFNVV